MYQKGDGVLKAEHNGFKRVKTDQVHDALSYEYAKKKQGSRCPCIPEYPIKLHQIVKVTFIEYLF
jgi:hypothetical protein